MHKMHIFKKTGIGVVRFSDMSFSHSIDITLIKVLIDKANPLFVSFRQIRFT